jgi:hypothetical protein
MRGLGLIMIAVTAGGLAGCAAQAAPVGTPAPAPAGVRQAPAAAVSAAAPKSTVGGTARPLVKPDRTVVLVATAEVKGTTEPCGCSSDPLGDVARVATLAQGGLLLDAGALLYDRDALSAPMRAQADAKAKRLAAVYGKAAVGLGLDDLARGAPKVSPPRLAANVTGVSCMPWKIYVVNGVKVGVFGVVSPVRFKEVPIEIAQPHHAARKQIERLKKEGAQVIVALLGMNRGEARALAEKVPGIQYAVVGAEVGDGMEESERVGDTWLVAPADQGRKVARLELHVAGNGPMVAVDSAAARTRKADKLQQKMDALAAQLEEWKKAPDTDAAFLAERETEMETWRKERGQLLLEKPPRPSGNWFSYDLVPVRTKIARDAQVAKELRTLARDIGHMNLEASRASEPPPAEDGQAKFVGVDACKKCHKAAVEQWRSTVHGRAWKTLVEVDKQYNYECTGCHVTGFQQPGGSHLASVEKKGLTDVQCEVCHGPGSLHVAEAGLEEPKSMKRKPADRFCADNCHTKEHSDTFELGPYLRDILGAGHGEKARAALGDGPTGHELRAKAIEAAKSK